MIVIQRIMTDWTKASRSGQAAALRNAVPEALAIPPFTARQGLVVHRAKFLEAEAFLCRDDLSEGEMIQSWRLGAMTVNCDGLEVIVNFEWAWNTAGAPTRKNHQAFVLRPAQWGRLMYNGRFGPMTYGESEWWYRKDVFNVAFADNVVSRLFLETTPDFVVSEMVAVR